MSYHFIDKKDPRIDVMFQGLEKNGEDAFSNGGCTQIPLQRGTVSSRTRNCPKSCG